MGLRLLAHYYDLCEAVVARSAVEAAGMLAYLHNEHMLTVQHYWLGALGGYRLMVHEHELADAARVLNEAVASPQLEGERLVLCGGFFDRMIGFGLGYFFCGGAPCPLRQSRWVEITAP